MCDTGVYGSADASKAASLSAVQAASKGGGGGASHPPFWGPPGQGMEACRDLEAYFQISDDGGEPCNHHVTTM